MLNFVFGRSGYGKTEYVFDKIKNKVINDKERVLLITPEQYSFIAEKRLLDMLGEKNISMVDNSSFSRLVDQADDIFGKEMVPLLSKGGRAVIMMQAISKCAEDFKLFNRNTDSIGFVSSMLKIYDEMKSCNLDGNQISQLCANIENIALSDKMSDISMIMNMYDSIISERYVDPADELTRLYNKLKDKNYFAGKNVYIDGFNGFVAQEYKLLELIIAEADEVIITLCTDNSSDDSLGLFTYVNNSAKIIEKIATKANININKINLLTNHRAQNDVMNKLEKEFFKECNAIGNNGSVEIYASRSITDECTQLSRQIRSLMRQGYRARDIAVITRDLNKYKDEIGHCFRKYDIPFYYDERQPIDTQPLVAFLTYLFRCINFSFRSDDILSLLKTGLTDISNDEINELENYIFLWGINGSKWKKPFDKSTKGLVDSISESDKTALDRINNVRERIIAPILSFSKAVKNSNPICICEQIYNFLIKIGADKKIRQYAIELSALNKPVLADEQGRVWDTVMSVLDYLPKTLPDESISLKDFAKIFMLVISVEDIGSIPSGLDNIQLGQADRIRTDNPRAVFILGANEGEFPQIVIGGGLLTEKDRLLLLENDFKLYSYGELLNIQENYFAYMACTCAKEKLFVSYTLNSKENAPSSIISEIEKSVRIDYEKSLCDIDDIDLIETRVNAFELMSEKYHTDTVFYSSLKKFFEDDTKYEAIKNIAENKDVNIKDKSLSTALFKYDMNLSASRIEDYYNCPFRYFCKFGLNAKPRNKAEIDPMQRGILIHYVLENILAQYGSKKLTEMTKPQMKSAVDEIIENYIKVNLNNVTDFDIRFDYNFKRLSKLIYSVVYHLAEEFSNSDFEARAFELDIDNDGSVKPQTIGLDDGGTIKIRGSIDRVDTYKKDEVTYVRVVDYKSGAKTFKLSDIMYGLNLQMFVYLFTLCRDKSAKLNGVPAGVLYMHSARELYSLDSRKNADDELSKKDDTSFKMKGIVIDENSGEIAIAMEHDLTGKYIPVQLKSNGDLKGSLASLAEFGLIEKKVNNVIAQMGMSLHNGLILKNPVKNSSHSNTCERCDYKDVCASKRNIDYRITEEISDEQVKNILKEEYSEND